MATTAGNLLNQSEVKRGSKVKVIPNTISEQLMPHLKTGSNNNNPKRLISEIMTTTVNLIEITDQNNAKSLVK